MLLNLVFMQTWCHLLRVEKPIYPRGRLLILDFGMGKDHSYQIRTSLIGVFCGGRKRSELIFCLIKEKCDIIFSLGLGARTSAQDKIKPCFIELIL